MQKKVLWAALHKLAKSHPDYTRAIIAVFLDGQTMKEHAKEQFVTKSAVSKWVKHGRRELLQLLNDQAAMEDEVKLFERLLELKQLFEEPKPKASG